MGGCSLLSAIHLDKVSNEKGWNKTRPPLPVRFPSFHPTQYPPVIPMPYRQRQTEREGKAKRRGARGRSGLGGLPFGRSVAFPLGRPPSASRLSVSPFGEGFGRAVRFGGLPLSRHSVGLLGGVDVGEGCPTGYLYNHYIIYITYYIRRYVM